MQVARRWIGAPISLLLLAILAGCGGKASPPKPTTPPKSQSTTAKTESTTAKPTTTKSTTTKSTASVNKSAPVKSGTATKQAPIPKSTENAPTVTKSTVTKSTVTKSTVAKAAAPSLAKKAVPKKSAALVGPDLGDGKLPLRDAIPEDAETKEDAAADKDLPYTVVKVFYATDRERLDADLWQKSLRGGWPVLTGVFAAIAVLLLLVRRRLPRILRGLAWASLAAALVFGGLTFVYRMQPAQAKKDIACVYGGGRGDFELGVCEVSIPKDHRMGELESPTILRLEIRPDPERHIVLLGVQPESPDDFYEALHSCVSRSPRKELFVFVHGYNVGFENAVRRTAQIAYDLKFDGAAITYSWPSQEGLFSYTIDENNVDWTVPHLKEFLRSLTERSGAVSVHLVAHSMGNRALTNALRELQLELRDDCPRFQKVVLTAPDVDADRFRRDLAPAIVKIADRVTLYASSNDKALIASREVHGYRRAGESGEAMVVVPGIDTIDVSEIDTSLIGHSYYGNSSSVLADLFELVKDSKPPDQRKWLRSMRLGAMTYWKFLKKKIDDAHDGMEL